MLSLTLVALSRVQTLRLETDVRGASAEGVCKWYSALASSDMQSLPQSPHSGQQALSTPAVDASVHQLSCSFVLPMRASPPQHQLGGLCSTSSSQTIEEWELGLRGWFWASCTVIKWDCFGERRQRRWSIMFCCAFHCSIVAFLFLSGQALMLYPLTFVVPVAMFHKHKMGNILSIRNLDCSFSPALLHSAFCPVTFSSATAQVLSFLSHTSHTFQHLLFRFCYSVCHV